MLPVRVCARDEKAIMHLKEINHAYVPLMSAVPWQSLKGSGTLKGCAVDDLKARRTRMIALYKVMEGKCKLHAHGAAGLHG